jgi:hypothetical protein
MKCGKFMASTHRAVRAWPHADVPALTRAAPQRVEQTLKLALALARTRVRHEALSYPWSGTSHLRQSDLPGPWVPIWG